jgi:hypothetical protein
MIAGEVKRLIPSLPCACQKHCAACAIVGTRCRAAEVARQGDQVWLGRTQPAHRPSSHDVELTLVTAFSHSEAASATPGGCQTASLDYRGDLRGEGLGRCERHAYLNVGGRLTDKQKAQALVQKENEFHELILRAYKATGFSGTEGVQAQDGFFHGARSGRLVVIGPINLPVGRLFVEEVITECRKRGVTRVVTPRRSARIWPHGQHDHQFPPHCPVCQGSAAPIAARPSRTSYNPIRRPRYGLAAVSVAYR